VFVRLEFHDPEILDHIISKSWQHRN